MDKISKFKIKKIAPLLLIGLSILFAATYLFLHEKPYGNDPEKYITESLERCINSEQRTVCLRSNARNFLQYFAIPDILAILKKNEQVPAYFSTCHELAHYMGQAAYTQYKSVPKVYSKINETCLGGMYHGTIEGYFMEKKLTLDGTPEMDTLIGKEVKIVCGKDEDYKLPFEFGTCIHGLGHALMYATDNDLVRALKLCDHLENRNLEERCYTGALMQNYTSIGDKDHPSKYAKADDPMYPCYILEKKYQLRCYTYGVLTNFQTSPQTAVALCNAMPEEYSLECFKTYGRDRTMVSDSPSEIKGQCDLAQAAESVAGCMQEAAGHLVLRFGVDSTLARDTCNLTAKVNQSECYLRIADISKTMTREKSKRIQFCQQIPNMPVQEICIRDADEGSI